MIFDVLFDRPPKGYNQIHGKIKIPISWGGGGGGDKVGHIAVIRFGVNMINETLFEILVYSCDQEAFLAYMTAKVEKQLIAYTFSPLLGPPADHAQQQRDEEMRTDLRNKEIQRQLKPVRYNELVGCIEVHSVFTQLRADYWFTERKRIVVGGKTKGTIRWQGKLLEEEYGYSSLTSQEIFQEFRSHLGHEAKRHPHLGRRCVDFGAFDRCGPFMNWRAVLGL